MTFLKNRLIQLVHVFNKLDCHITNIIETEPILVTFCGTAKDCPKKGLLLIILKFMEVLLETIEDKSLFGSFDVR